MSRQRELLENNYKDYSCKYIPDFKKKCTSNLLRTETFLAAWIELKSTQNKSKPNLVRKKISSLYNYRGWKRRGVEVRKSKWWELRKKICSEVQNESETESAEVEVEQIIQKISPMSLMKDTKQ